MTSLDRQTDEGISVTGGNDGSRLGGIKAELREDAVTLQPPPVIHGAGVTRECGPGGHGAKAHPVAILGGHSGPPHLNENRKGDRLPFLSH